MEIINSGHKSLFLLKQCGQCSVSIRLDRKTVTRRSVVFVEIVIRVLNKERLGIKLRKGWRKFILALE